jgi:hypothetical protein
MKLLLALLLINICLMQLGIAQLRWFEQDSSSRAMPQWWAGVDMVKPALLQLDNYSGWQQAVEAEAFITWRRGSQRWAPRLGASYFYGLLPFDNGYNRLAAFVLKPGLSYHISPEDGLGLYFRTAIPFSVAANVNSKSRSYDLVYEQDYSLETTTNTGVVGFEFAYGYSARIGKLILCPELVFISGKYHNIYRREERDSMYIAGIGRTSGWPFTNTGFAINLFIGRAW